MNKTLKKILIVITTVVILMLITPIAVSLIP